MTKLELVTREVLRIVTQDHRMLTLANATETPLTVLVFNTISRRHEIECFFAIEFEQEQVDAWTTVQNIIDDVMNLWVSPITDPVIKRGIVGEVAPEAIMPPFHMEKGQMILNEVALPQSAKFKDGKLFVNDVEVPESKIYRTEPLTPSEAINRIEREDVNDFRKHIHPVPYLAQPTNALDIYQRIATKSAIYPGKGTPFGLMYAALGLAEAGEVQNKVKKAFRDDGVVHFADHLPGHPEANTLAECRVIFQPITLERRAQIIKELGGALWYIAAVCDEIGTTMSEVALQNLDELCGRGERNTLRGDGDNR